MSWSQAWEMSFLYGPIQSWESSLPVKRFNKAIDRMSSHLSKICKPTSIHLFLKLPVCQIIPWSLVHWFQSVRAGGEMCRKKFSANVGSRTVE